MDIASLSIGLKQYEVQQQAGMAVMRMAMDTAKVQADAFSRMAESIQDPSLGTLIDTYA